MGAMQVIAAALEQIGIDGEGDTSDGKLSLRYNTCLGACAQAPVISADHNLMGRQSPEKVRAVLTTLMSNSILSDKDDH
jgi:NADH:ubiquinone oxidoreductase subunit E